MGWLDKGFKNILKGGKELLSSPAGIMALGVLAPYAAPWMTKVGGMKGLGMLKSPMISNALKNAAMNYGIATLTGSKHPGKAALWAGAASLPFTYLQGAQAASQYNKLPGITDKKTWADFSLGNVSDTYKISGGDPTQTFSFDKTMIDDPAWTMPDELLGQQVDIPQIASYSKNYDPLYSAAQTKNVPEGINMNYFTRDPSAAQIAATQSGGIGSLPAVLGLENIDVMASLVPQVAGLYGGRMSPEERWLAAQEKQIRMWAFQFGIPYEEAKEIWKDGWKNPYYTTKTPGDYGIFANRGGYIDDYTAGGKAVGPGTGKSDSIQPVALSNGEFVFTEKATNRFPGGADGLYSLMNRLDPESETPQEARA
jgi:hypothetical protein